MLVLHEDMNEIMDEKPYEPYPPTIFDFPAAELARMSWEYHRSRERSLFVDKCSGQYQVTSSCYTCNYTSYKYDIF